MAFTPRTTAPGEKDKYYLSTAYGGYNPFKVRRSSGSTLANCVAYAWGRFMEISGIRPKLSTGNAVDWYRYTSDGYQRGQVPKLGAVICWSGGTYGHVAIVEKIYNDGSKYPKILISESSYGGAYFATRDVGTGYGYNYGNKTCQGFIYNPAVSGSGGSSKLTDFLKVAEKHSNGENGSWAWSTAGHTSGQPWCATFVTACAKTVGGLINVILPDTAWAGGFAQWGDQKKIGRIINGPYFGQHPQPQRGDLVTFRWKSKGSYGNQSSYYADHVAIVYNVSGDTVYTYEGNLSGKSGRLSYNWRTCTSIFNYYRPAWNNVGVLDVNDDGYPYAGGTLYGSVYSTENDDNDAIVREVGYLDSQGEPSIQASDKKLSVVNYTTLLNAMFSSTSMDGSYGTYPSTDNSGISADKLNNVARNIVQYFSNKGLSVAVGIGICGNVQQECGFDISLSGIDSNGKMSGGMVQWNASNFSKMVSQVPDWKTNLTGQLNFLWQTMTTDSSYVSFIDYKAKQEFGYNGGMLSLMASQPNTREGAMQVARIFVRCYEISGDRYQEKRPNNAAALWDKLVITR